MYIEGKGAMDQKNKAHTHKVRKLSKTTEPLKWKSGKEQ